MFGDGDSHLFRHADQLGNESACILRRSWLRWTLAGALLIRNSVAICLWSKPDDDRKHLAFVRREQCEARSRDEPWKGSFRRTWF